MPTNVKSIASAIQKEKLEWQAEANDITNLTETEQQKRLGVILSEREIQELEQQTIMQAARETQEDVTVMSAPQSFDWRNVNGNNFVTPVKNQGSCGSCVSFCTVAVMESAVRIKLNNPNENVNLSEAFCQFCGGGSCSGWGLTSGLAFAKSTGVTDDACMPYQPTNMNCANSRCSDWQNRLTKIHDYSSYSSMAARKKAIAEKGPLLAGMAVYNDFFAYSSGVYVKTANATYQGLHCICVVGYNDQQQCWIIKNSWGTNWGDGGFCRIRYNQPDVKIDSSFSFYSVDIEIKPRWYNNVKVNQTYATHHEQNAWVNLQGVGWRRIKTGSAEGVTNMHVLFTEASANNRAVSVYADAEWVYRAYLL